MRLWIALLALMFTDSAGNLLMAKGMKDVGPISTLQPRTMLKFAQRVIKNHFIWVGFMSQACTFFLFLTLLSWADLSVVIPLGSLSYLINILGAKYILKEKITQDRWIGTVCICIGVLLISLNTGGASTAAPVAP